MPTPPKKHRTYCKCCSNFTIHSWNVQKELECDTCNAIYTPYKPSEVKPELIKQQRDRYKQKKTKDTLGIYGAFMTGFGMEAIMGMGDFYSQNIVECDAGQDEIDRHDKQVREEAKKEAQKILNDYNINYKKLGRNDKCSCGSGRKFKQCHLQHFNKYLIL